MEERYTVKTWTLKTIYVNGFVVSKWELKRNQRNLIFCFLTEADGDSRLMAGRALYYQGSQLTMGERSGIRFQETDEVVDIKMIRQIHEAIDKDNNVSDFQIVH